MAATVQDIPWDDQTDVFITNLDKALAAKYQVSLRDLLLDPDKFTNNKDMLAKMEKMKDDIDKYFDGLKDDMADEKAAFTQSLENAGKLYDIVDNAIATKASFSRIPYIIPTDITYDTHGQEEITVEKYDNATDALLTKLINVSNYIGNVSATYDKYNIGSWVFSGQKVYVLSIYLQESIIMDFDTANADINDLFDSAYQQIRINQGK